MVVHFTSKLKDLKGKPLALGYKFLKEYQLKLIWPLY
jgi:hypothetical protein